MLTYVLAFCDLVHVHGLCAAIQKGVAATAPKLTRTKTIRKQIFFFNTTIENLVIMTKT